MVWLLMAVMSSARATPPAPAAACAPAPEVELVIQITSREANPRFDYDPTPRLHQLRTLRDLDLDGDGVLDAAVPTLRPHGCPHQVEYRLYVTRGACAEHVGTVLGSPQVPTSGAGWREVRTHRRWAELTDRSRPPGPDNVATLHEVTATWRYQAGVYAEVSSEPRAGICHHCGIPSCRIVEP